MTPVFAVSETTQKILKNFSGISSQILLREGKSQRNCTKSKSVLALAELPEAWPKETAVFDLPKLVGTLSNFSKPGIEFGDEVMVIRDVHETAQGAKYQYSDPSLILTEDRTPELGTVVLEFTLTETTASRLKKFSGQLDLTDISIKLESGNVVLTAFDGKNPRSHKFEVTIPAEDVPVNDGTFGGIKIKIEHFQMLLEGAYTLRFGGKPFGYFVHKTLPVSYFVSNNKD